MKESVRWNSTGVSECVEIEKLIEFEERVEQSWSSGWGDEMSFENL